MRIDTTPRPPKPTELIITEPPAAVAVEAGEPAVAAVSLSQLEDRQAMLPIAPHVGTWRATTSWRLAHYQGVPADAVGDELSRFAGRLAEWLSSLDVNYRERQAALQLRIAADPEDYRVTVHVIMETDGVDSLGARSFARTLSESFGQLATGSRLLRWEPVVEPTALSDLLQPAGWTTGRGAMVPAPVIAEVDDQPVLGLHPRQPGGGAAMAEVVRLMLAQRAPTAVCVSLQGSHDHRALREQRALVSKALAQVKSRLAGVEFGTRHHAAAISCFPEDLLELEAAEHRLREVAGWLDALHPAALRCRVDLVGVDEPSDPLLHAVQRALIGAAVCRWLPATEDQVRLVDHGPLCAFDCPRPEVGIRAPHHQLLAACVPPAVAESMLEAPWPSRDGLPGITLQQARRRPLPGRLVRASSHSLLGLGFGPRGEAAVRMSDDDLARHLYIPGKTGVGKTTMIRSLFVDLALQGQGVGIIDPHGDVAAELEARLEGSRRLVIFDPVRDDCPGLDPLRNDGSRESKERAIEEISSIIFRIYPPEYMGPQFDRFSRCLLVPLIAAERSLSDVARMISDKAFRARCLARLDSGIPLEAEVRRFWQSEYPLWDGEYRGQMINYTVSKYEALVKSSHLQRVCAPDRPQLDLQAVADRGDVLLVRIPQGTVGPVSAWFLGMMLASRLFDVIFSRANAPQDERRPFTLFLDEFHNLLGRSGFGYTKSERTLAPLLAESRKFGLRLVLANQYIHQLDPETREALLGNVGSLAVFRVGTTDAELLSRELGSDLTADELRGLPLYQSVARLLVDGEPTPLFSLRTVPPDQLDHWTAGRQPPRPQVAAAAAMLPAAP